MNSRKISRRQALVQAGLLAGTAVATRKLSAQDTVMKPTKATDPFLFCLNTATIRGQKLGIVQEIDIAAKAGYSAIEPWVSAIEEYVKKGGALKDLKKRIDDAGLVVASAIGFPEWIVDDDARRAKGLERAKYEMDLVKQIGGLRFAAPPAGATDKPGLNLRSATERYRALLDLGDQIGLIPQLELWGFSKNLHYLGECVGVALDTGHPKACVLADVFHMYKGGSDFHGMHMLGRDAIQVLHMNDYPAEPPPQKIDDSFRVYPGDGTAPLTDILQTLHRTGGQKVLSLEVFNRGYWAQDPLAVAKTGLAKMKAVAAKVKA
jgi:sugar phosphate isomerase/epimerase